MLSNAPIHASSHNEHVRPFKIGLIQHMLKTNCPLGFDLADYCQKVPWERSRVAFSEVIFGENIGRYEAPKIGMCDFRSLSEAYHADILGSRKKRTPFDTVQTPSFHMV